MEKLKNLTKSRFGKNVMIVAGGTAFAQALAFLLSPIITRIYSPEEFGIVTVYTAILGILVIYASLRYERTIPIAESKEKSIAMLFLSFLILILYTLIIGLIILLMGSHFLKLFEGELIYKYRMLIPVGLFFAGSYQIINQWALKDRNFKGIGKTKINQSISGNGMQIVLGLIGLGPLGLIIGRIISQSAGVTTLGKSLFKEKKYLVSVSIKDMLWGLRRYYHFPLYSGPSKLFHRLTTQLPIVFLASLYGGQVVGLYGLANSVIKMPMALLGTSIANVFFGEVANLGKENPKKIKDLTKNLQTKLIILGAIPMIALLLFGPYLFQLAFGEEWRQAGEYARLLSLTVFFNFITSPISNVVSVFEKMKESLWLTTLRLLLVLIVFGIATFLSLNSYWAVGLYSIAMSINYLAIYSFSQWVINKAIDEKVASS